MNRLRNVPVDIVHVKQRIDTIDGVIRKLDDPTLEIVARLSLIDSVSAQTMLSVGQVIQRTGTGVSDDSAAASAVPLDDKADAANGTGRITKTRTPSSCPPWPASRSGSNSTASRGSLNT